MIINFVQMQLPYQQPSKGDKMSWNPVLNKFIEIKNTYKNKIGEPTYSYKSGYTDESKTCLE